LATATGSVFAAQARFFRAIPEVAVGLLAARPVRRHYLDRVETLFGPDARRAIETTHAPRSAASERDLLSSYLFEPPHLLADRDRPRSAGPDGTVTLEEHAGIEEEVEATADWVARQIVDGIALEDIAVLAPRLDPFAELIATRLARLPWPGDPPRAGDDAPRAGDDAPRSGREEAGGGTLPVHVFNGRPLTATAAGARALAVVRALRAHLAGEALIGVLPALRPTAAEGEEDARRLSHGTATELIWTLGTAGGSSGRPEGALDWSACAASREQSWSAQLQRAEAADNREAIARAQVNDLANAPGREPVTEPPPASNDDPEQAGLVRRRRELERLLTNLRAVRPALDALVGVAQLAVGGASLATLWPALHAFLEDWLLQPGAGPRVQTLLEERLAAAVGDSASGALTADDALRVVEGAIAAARLPAGRFGEPAVYVGTVRDAVGLRFHAVRIVGLAEGYLPDPPREDPVLPDSLRAGLAVGWARPVAPTTIADRALAGLHALDVVVRDAEKRVSLSAPRLDLERSQREPSSVMLEAAAALGRPHAVTGERPSFIPDAASLERDAFLPARRDRGRFRRELPLAESAWQDGVATGELAIPARWLVAPALDLQRIRALLDADEPGPMDGILGALDIRVPGLTPEWPLSPSTLGTLLACPHRFLLERVLGFEEPAEAPKLREVGQPDYGSLVHRIAEVFLRTHGGPFAARADSLEAWLARADEVVERVFAGFLEEYPLVGNAVRGKERERLRSDVQDLLRDEWRQGARRLVDTERAFGPLALSTGARDLFVRGRIDRIDADAQQTLVRDLKTGRAQRRFGKEAGPSPALDAQLAVYGLVAKLLAGEWGTPARIGVAYTHVNRGVAERAYRQDFHDVLEPAARQWLDLAADLLAAREFPRTPNVDDCRYCAFRPVCGPGVYERAARLLAEGDEILARFRGIKRLAAPED
jgi:RecB family exonuclease